MLFSIKKKHHGSLYRLLSYISIKKKNKEKQSIFAGIILKYWQESWRGKILVKL